MGCTHSQTFVRVNNAKKKIYTLKKILMANTVYMRAYLRARTFTRTLRRYEHGALKGNLFSQQARGDASLTSGLLPDPS